MQSKGKIPSYIHQRGKNYSLIISSVDYNTENGYSGALLIDYIDITILEKSGQKKKKKVSLRMYKPFSQANPILGAYPKEALDVC